MSAYDDIKFALEAAPPCKPGFERVILVGCSGRQSLVATSTQGQTPMHSLRMIEGVPVRDAMQGDDLKGWVIRDMSPGGCWYDMRGRPATDPNFERGPLVAV